MLPNVDENLLQSQLISQLQFNPDYYRIYTPQETLENERAIAAEEESKHPQLLQRRNPQPRIKFPISPSRVNRGLLCPLQAFGTEDSDGEDESKIRK